MLDLEEEQTALNIQLQECHKNFEKSTFIANQYWRDYEKIVMEKPTAEKVKSQTEKTIELL